MKKHRNNFEEMMGEEDSRFHDLDHDYIQKRIHNRIGTLRFVGHLTDMYLGKLFRTAGMKLGSQEVGGPEGPPPGPAGPAEPE